MTTANEASTIQGQTQPLTAISRRFPLVARFRPACTPLLNRVRALVDLADNAVNDRDQGLASAVYNQAALLASDVGLPDLARQLCHQHAAAYLHACPLPALSAIRGLEPVVNLARIHIRAARRDDGRGRLHDLYQAVHAGADAEFDSIAVPANLTTNDERREVLAWLWRVQLADGTRTLTAEGRWTEALAHVQAHNGIGSRMLDGRQVAILAALHSDQPEHAETLLSQTAPGEPWEHLVTACLAALHRCATGEPVTEHLADLAAAYTARTAEPGTTVFDTRVGLTILDTASLAAAAPVLSDLVDQLHQRTVEAQDGYAARECLAAPAFTTRAPAAHLQDCRDLIRACGLGTGSVPDELEQLVRNAVRASDHVIRDSVEV